MRIKGQVVIEYAVIFVVVVSALLAMSIYTKRALQGRFRSNTQAISEGRYYSPKETIGGEVIRTNITEERSSTLVQGVMFIGNDVQNSDTNSTIGVNTVSNEIVLPPA